MYSEDILYYVPEICWWLSLAFLIELVNSESMIDFGKHFRGWDASFRSGEIPESFANP